MPKQTSITRFYQAPMGRGRMLELKFSENAKDVITGIPFTFENDKEMRFPHNIALDNFANPEDVFFGSTDTTLNARIIEDIRSVMNKIVPNMSTEKLEEIPGSYEALFYITEIIDRQRQNIKQEFVLKYMLLPILNTLVGANAVLKERQKKPQAENTRGPDFFRK